MKFLELAKMVLTEVKKPMSATDIWDYAVSKGYIVDLETSGSTPQMTLSARLYTAANDPKNGTFSFIGLRPKRFFLNGITPESSLHIDEEAEIEKAEKRHALSYKEKDLHALLAYFIRTRFDAFPKTINHSTSKKKEFGEWTHPDMVACHFPRPHWKTDVYELSSLLGDVQLAFLSFELKLRLSFANLRESFFQAVSNSSWAHEGYLVAANINAEPDFRDELSRLSNSFGIGVIELIPHDPDASQIICYPKENDYVDWDTVNKLSSMNRDFSEFISRVKKDVSSKEVREEWYDKFLEMEEIVKMYK